MRIGTASGAAMHGHWLPAAQEESMAESVHGRRTGSGKIGEQTRLFERARLQLARLHASGGVSLREVWRDLADLVANALDVDRVGVWVLIDEGRALRCRYLLQRSSKNPARARR
jgi:hypothetical protein